MADLGNESRRVRRTVSRRGLLRGGVAGAGGLLSAALIGCGTDDKPSNSGGALVIPPGTGGAPADAVRTKGGTLRFGFLIPTRVSPRGATGGTHQEYLNVLGDSYIYINSQGDFDPKLS